MEKTEHPKFVRWAVLLGIVVVLNLFFWVGRSFVVPEPLFEDYCPNQVQPMYTEEQCVEAQGVWVNYGQTTRETTSETKAMQPVPAGEDGYCDMYKTCQPLFDEAHKEFQMYSFVIMVGLGVLSLFVGVLPIGSSIVSSGLSYGGVLALVIAAVQYWGEAENLLRLGISLVALIALLYIGIKRFKD